MTKSNDPQGHRHQDKAKLSNFYCSTAIYVFFGSIIYLFSISVYNEPEDGLYASILSSIVTIFFALFAYIAVFKERNERSLFIKIFVLYFLSLIQFSIQMYFLIEYEQYMPLQTILNIFNIIAIVVIVGLLNRNERKIQKD